MARPSTIGPDASATQQEEKRRDGHQSVLFPSGDFCPVPSPSALYLHSIQIDQTLEFPTSADYYVEDLGLVWAKSVAFLLGLARVPGANKIEAPLLMYIHPWISAFRAAGHQCWDPCLA